MPILWNLFLIFALEIVPNNQLFVLIMIKEVKLVNSELDGCYEIKGLEDGRSYGFINPTVHESLDSHLVPVNLSIPDFHFIQDPLEVVMDEPNFSNLGLDVIKK